MKVFKFGGASIKNAAAIQNVGRIISANKDEQLLIVVSAIGKTTNSLEAILEAYYKQDTESSEQNLAFLKQKYQTILEDLFPLGHSIFDTVAISFLDLESKLTKVLDNNYDYWYDQIISLGELLSSKILTAYLKQLGLETRCLDAREYIATDNTHRSANINWNKTKKNIQATIPSLLKKELLITQGFIARSSDNSTTTLGREGSDFSAAIFSYCLEAENMSVWKDVSGVFTGDPSLFKNMKKLDKISYKEAIEITYYGAHIIHPKTILPLQNKKIPLQVKSFIHPKEQGTTISQYSAINYPSIFIVKSNQTLLKIKSKHLNFINEEKYAELFFILSQNNIKVNFSQNTALELSICIHNDSEKVEKVIQDLSNKYTIQKIDDLKLLTIRHIKTKDFDQLILQSKIHVEKRTQEMSQVVLNSSQFEHLRYKIAKKNEQKLSLNYRPIKQKETNIY